MKMLFSCLSEDTEFIDLVNKEFATYGTVSEYKVSGITGYEVTTLVLQITSVAATVIVPFYIQHMSKNKDDKVKSNRCIIDSKNKIISFEGCDEEVIREFVEKAIQEHNK